MFGHPKTQRMHALQIAAWLTMQNVQTEYYCFLILVFAFTFDFHVFGSRHKLVFNNLSECLLFIFMIIYVQALPTRYVTVDVL